MAKKIKRQVTKKGKYIGDCETCGLMLMEGDKRCPRCNKKVKVDEG